METKLKFKVGDKVRVKSLEWYNSNRNINKEIIAKEGMDYGVFSQFMRSYCGEVLMIDSVRNGYYTVMGIGWKWYDWMLEDEVVTEEKKEVENKNIMKTKEQAREYLTQKKFCVSNITEARNVVRFLKNLDIDILPCFMYGFTETLIPFYHETEDEYKEDDYEEITLQDILSIKIVEEEPEPKFDPKILQDFDKVLVREEDTNKWRLSFFDTYEPGCFYCIDYCYKQCVPYNEETKNLIGKTKEAPEFYQVWKK